MSTPAATIGARYDIRLPTVVFRSVGRTHLVNHVSRKRDRQAVERLGLYFKRECGFDFQPYVADEHLNIPELVVHLLPLPHAPIIDGWVTHVCGAVAFQRNYYSKALPDRWVMMWVWIHPFARGDGMLESYWPEFAERYKDFVLQPPLSKAMQVVADRCGYVKPGVSNP